jgi:imidazolonepropionase-like amidohydrolase
MSTRAVVAVTFAFVMLSHVVLSNVVLINVALAQNKAQDRRDYIQPGTHTSDDPRRVPLPPGFMQPEGSIVLIGGRVFDGTGSPARAASILIKGNRISAILSPESREWPEGAQVIQLNGKTVMPGLIDMHVHMAYKEKGGMFPSHDSEADAALRAVERLRFYIESGITTVRDVGSVGVVPFRLKSWVMQDRLALPRIFAAGQVIVGNGGHGTESGDFDATLRLASGPDDWREAVREQFARGADLIKVGSHFSLAEISAAVDEAHDLGLKVTVDAETFYIQRAVEAGVDIIEHPLPRSAKTISLMAKNDTESIPTLIPYNHIFDLAGGYWGSTSRRFTFSKEANRKMLRDLKKAGIKMGIGTDLVADWFRALPAPYIAELQEFVIAGYSVAQALICATRINAEILDMGDKLGTLEPGKMADVIVIDGRPDENLRDLANVELVIRDGEIVVKEGRVFIPRHVPEGAQSWFGVGQKSEHGNSPK